MHGRCLVAATLILVAACGAAHAMSLDGQWTLHRGDSADRPGADAQWTEVAVPSYLSQRNNQPHAWYRRSFRVPDNFAGRRVFIRFQAVRFVSEVYVNGTKVGRHCGGWGAFEIDITGKYRVGQPNELLVCVRDVTGVIDQPMDYSKQGRGIRFVAQANNAIMMPVSSQYSRFGIWQPVELVARHDVYIDDMFVKTSVRNQEIEVDVTLRNLGDSARKVRLASRVKQADLAVGETDLQVPAGSSVTATFKRSWPNPRLWGPEDPHLYHLVTTVDGAEGRLDTRDTRFGFREFWIDGTNHVLNGVPMKFLATAGHPRGDLDGGLSKASAIDFYRRIRETGCVAMRLHANIWPKCWYEAADEVGMPIIMESALFCYARNYALTKPKFWENYHEHLRTILKDHRNHPSIVMISLENEIVHCGGGEIDGTIHRLAEAGRLVKRLDPTRPIMYDGDGDPEGVADVVNIHYPLNFNERNLWPNVGYWLETGMKLACWPREFWSWDRKKPLYFGEFLHLQHYREVDPYTTLLGDDAYQDMRTAMARAKAIAWEMQIKAYRATGVSGMCPWTLTETGDFPSDDNPRYLAVKKAYQKNAAFVRQCDTRFFAGETVDRTVDLYNDTLHPARLSVAWRLTQGETVVDSGSRQFDAKPADSFKFNIRLKMPPADKRTPLLFTLTTNSGGKKVFEDQDRYWVFPKRPLRVPAGLKIALFEGGNRVVGRALEEAGVAVAQVADLAAIPASNLLIIGPHALDSLKVAEGVPVVGGTSEASRAIRSLLDRGGSILVLEQNSYDCGLLPARLVDRGATIAFQRSNASKLFARIGEGDFRFWRDGHMVAEKTIAKPQEGRYRVLVDSGGPSGLVYLPLLEVVDGRGRFLLSQLLVGEKLDREPIARLMLENMIAHAAYPVARPEELALVQDKLPLAEVVADVGALATDVSGKLDRTDLGRFGTLLVEADCAEALGGQEKIRAFVSDGGRAILHAATTRGLARLQKLFAEPISVQLNSSVPVAIAKWDPVIDGLGSQELYWYGSRKGLSWRTRTPLSTDVCHFALAARPPKPSLATTIRAESMMATAGTPRMDENGAYLHTNGSIAKQVIFPDGGDYSIVVRGRGTPVAGVYPRIAVLIDGQHRGSITTAGTDWGDYSLSTAVEKGAHTVTLAFVNDTHDPAKNEDRNVAIAGFTFGPTPPMNVKRLLEPAALTKIPLGKGFYLLDQIRWHDSGGAEKGQRYLANLLMNLNCPFADSTGAVRFTGEELVPDKRTKLFRSSNGIGSLGTNGTVYHEVRFQKTGRYQFAVKASGTEAGGEFPNIRLSIDGKPVGDLTIRRAGWQTLRLEADVSEGLRELGLSFTNDFYDPPADRNLKIANVRISSRDGR